MLVNYNKVSHFSMKDTDQVIHSAQPHLSKRKIIRHRRRITKPKEENGTITETQSEPVRPKIP